MKPIDPESRDEWQEAVNLANAYLQIHAAVLYGLIVGGPTINFERCNEILELGKLQGVTPCDSDGVAQVIALAHSVYERSRAVYSVERAKKVQALHAGGALSTADTSAGKIRKAAGGVPPTSAP